MYDEFGLFNSKTTTETEKESVNQYVQPNTYSSHAKNEDDFDYRDDYTINQNYKEETNYQYNRANEEVSSTEVQKYYKSINAPLIQRKVEEKQGNVVALTRSREVVKVTGRMKIAISIFLVIVASLIALISWNFTMAGKINASLDAKQVRINELQSSINGLVSEYNIVSDDGYLKDLANKAGFVDADETNTVVIDIGEVYTKAPEREVPSNWFNDVCDFFSKIFG